MPCVVSRRSPGKGLHVSFTGPLTLKDLKRGLLLLVREDGWQEPVLWDFREVTDVQIAYADLVATLDFIGQFMAHFPTRGRVALLTTEPKSRALAMTYRELQNRELRKQIAVVGSLADGNAWLDADVHVEIHPRALRFAVRDAVGSLDGVGAEVVDVSQSGALLIAPHAPRLGEELLFTLQMASAAIHLKVRLVRAHPHSQAGVESYWQLAVEFLDPPEALEQLRILMVNGREQLSGR